MQFLKGYAGIWEDTILEIQSYLPEWITGTVKIDIEPTPEGIERLKRMLPEIEGKTVLMSARTQYTLWLLLRQTAEMIDDMFEKSLTLPPETGAELRRKLIKMKNDVLDTAKIIFNANETALKMGVKPAIKDEWLLMEYPERTMAGAGAGLLASPGFWGLFAIIVIAVAIVVGGWVITKAVKNYHQANVLKDSIDKFIEIGRPDLIPELLKAFPEYKGKKFPYGWVIGIGLSSIAGLMIFSWALKKI